VNYGFGVRQATDAALQPFVAGVDQVTKQSGRETGRRQRTWLPD